MDKCITPEVIGTLNDSIEHNVVVLGSRFFKEDIIDMISAKLTQNGYTPIIAFKISENFELHFTPRQRICWFLANSRFVIAEDSVPSGEIIELEYCRNLGVTTAVLHDKNLPRSSWMTLDIDIHGTDFNCFGYDKNDKRDISARISEAIIWANNRNDDKKKSFEDKHEEYIEKRKVFDKPEVKAAMQMLKDNL